MGYKKIVERNLTKIRDCKSPKSVLDVGCGDKVYSKLFGPNNKYFGIDIEESGRTEETKKPDAFFDGSHIPANDNSYDLVICTAVLEHAQEAQVLLHEIFRVVKPKGTAYISVPFIIGEHEVPYDFRRYTSFGLIKVVEQTGFKIEKVEKDEVGIDAFKKFGLRELKPGFRKKNSIKSKLVNKAFVLFCKFLKFVGADMPRIHLSTHIICEKGLTNKKV